jgi:hypothetical protein
MVWNGDAETGKNSPFQDTFWGFLGFSEEEKGPQMEKLEKHIYSTFCILINLDNFSLVKVFQKCIVWERASLARNSKSRKRGEKDKVVISRLL